uniref:Uncharacterized protein n=1 Tax=Peronospora matthiolae TaxID=2874970 RepID=A0AAV1V4Z6_9STRA
MVVSALQEPPNQCVACSLVGWLSEDEFDCVHIENVVEGLDDPFDAFTTDRNSCEWRTFLDLQLGAGMTSRNSNFSFRLPKWLQLTTIRDLVFCMATDWQDWEEGTG